MRNMQLMLFKPYECPNAYGTDFLLDNTVLYGKKTTLTVHRESMC